MADALDMSLDDLISKNKSKSSQPRPRGRGAAAPPPRRRFDARAAAAPYHHRRGFFQARAPTMAHAGYAQPPMMRPAIDTPTSLYISNLDYGVTNDDIKELFSDVGDLKRYSINYDRSGRSKGTAEIVFSRRSDALAALKRYNNVQLDGKPMKIEIIGTDLELPRPSSPSFTFNPPAGDFHVPFKSRPVRGGAGGWPRGRGGFGARGRGRGDRGARGRGRGDRGRGRGGRGSEKVSAEDLDADLDKYHAAAMETS